MNEYQKIGLRLENARKNKGMTIQQVADRINLSKSTISRYENGLVENMSSPTIQTLADIYNVNVMWLLGKSNDKEVRATKSNTNSIPLLGQIAAGSPILAEENIEDYFNIDHSVRADFALRIKGNSMIDANIHDGDIAFIKSQSTLENGEIGAVVINEEATLKRFYFQDGVIILRPENADYEPIVVTNGNVRIAGKLCAVLSIK